MHPFMSQTHTRTHPHKNVAKMYKFAKSKKQTRINIRIGKDHKETIYSFKCESFIVTPIVKGEQAFRTSLKKHAKVKMDMRKKKHTHAHKLWFCKKSHLHIAPIVNALSKRKRKQIINSIWKNVPSTLFKTNKTNAFDWWRAKSNIYLEFVHRLAKKTVRFRCHFQMSYPIQHKFQLHIANHRNVHWWNCFNFLNKKLPGENDFSPFLPEKWRSSKHTFQLCFLLSSTCISRSPNSQFLWSLS